MPEALFFGGSGFYCALHAGNGGGSGFYCARLQTSACPFSLPADSGSNISFRAGPAQRSAEGASPGKTSLSVPFAPPRQGTGKKEKRPSAGRAF